MLNKNGNNTEKEHLFSTFGNTKTDSRSCLSLDNTLDKHLGQVVSMLERNDP